ncbi:hypothetical protein [Dactylosporangium sp. NPDC051541]|uniref:VMAP-C domain-containing protein n=1 Tax=Dactylosporangium sp. NPDC051541 TaxID=3363977 RepID=UPI003787B204
MLEASQEPVAELVAHRRRIRRELIQALTAAPVLQSADGWSLFLHELSLILGSGMHTFGQGPLQTRAIKVVNFCGQRTEGMRSIAESIELLDPESAETAEIHRWVNEWHVVDLLAGIDFLWLREELEALPATTGDCYRHAAAVRLTEQPTYCTNAWQLFASLAGENASDGAPPCLRFLERIAPHLPAVADLRLRELFATLAARWELADYQAERPAPPAAPPAPADMAYLIIQFEKYGGDGDSYLVTHWRQWAAVWQPIRGQDRRVPEAGLESAVEEIVTEVERRWADRMGPVTIEFVLPDPLLDLPVEEFRRELRSIEATPLAVKYPIYVRSLNRLRSTEWHRVWRTRWQLRTTNQEADGVLHCAADGSGAIQVEASISGGTVVLVLSEPPTPGSIGERQLLAGLRAGLPAVLWHRRMYPSPQRCETVASMIRDALLGSGLAELPIHVAELRRQAWGEGAQRRHHHVGSGIVILWDDPDRLPERATAGSSTGEARG